MTELYKSLNLISPIQKKTWERVNALFFEKTLLKGEYFITEGETAKQIGFLTNGVIRAFYRNSEGVEYNKHFFVANNFFGGYSSLITLKPNLINQQALINCRFLVANYTEIEKLFNIFPDFEKFGRKLAELYFVNKEHREIEIVLLDADKRYLIFQKNYPQLAQLIPQYHIASYLGISATQLSRIRRKMVKSNISLPM